MVEAGTDPEAAAERARMFRAEIGTAVFHNFLERDPIGGLARIDNGTFDGVLDEESKANAREQLSRIAQADVDALNARAAFDARAAELERAANRRASIRDLTAGLRDGVVHEGHIARALYRGEIGHADADALSARLKEFSEQRLRRAEALDRFDAVVNGDAQVDETQWEPQVIEAWAARERERGTPISTVATECFGKTRSVPNPILDTFRTLILSASPEDSMMAAHEYRVLAKEAPEAARFVRAALPKSEARELELYSEYAGVALPPERIAELVDRRREEEKINSVMEGGSPVDDDDGEQSWGDEEALEEAQADGNPGADGSTDDERFNAFRERLRPREGGYAERRGDPGGPTDEGISSKFLEAYNRKHPEKGYSNDPADLTSEEKTRLYREEFYDRPKIGRLAEVPGLAEAAPRLAEHIFDAGVLHGPEAAGMWLQEALNEKVGADLKVDGNIGPKTRDALAEAVRQGKAREIHNTVVDKRLDWMRNSLDLANNRGWLPRAESFRD
jgi:lysozyme family protein